MLKKLVIALIVVCCASMVSAGEIVKGQTYLSLGVGASSPQSEFGDLAETGYLAGASFGYWISPQTAIGGEFNYHSYGIPNVLQTVGVDESGSVIQFTAFGKYLLTYSNSAPYIKYVLGLYNWKLKQSVVPVSGTPSQSDLGIGGGVGVQFGGNGKVGGFVEAIYHNVFKDFSNLKFLDLRGGVTIQCGGGGY